MNELFDLSGSVAIVTGAGSGLGKTYAVTLAQAHAHVVCMGRHRSSLQDTVDKITRHGGSAVAIPCDVSSAQEIGEAVEQTMTTFGSIDILVNNAGTEKAQPFLDVTAEDFDYIVSVNLRGVFLMAQACAKRMHEQHSGKIINIASLGSFIGLRDSSVYCATKGAVVQLTKTMALELAEDQIQVNAIAPGYFRTEMTEDFFRDPHHEQWIRNHIPTGRVGSGHDLSGPLLFLASHASNYVNGHTLVVDGGWLSG